MENCVIKNSKRPYHSTMGPLLEDFNTLSKRRKKLFDNINTQIDTLIKLLQDTDDKLNSNHLNHLNNHNLNGLSHHCDQVNNKSNELNGLNHTNDAHTTNGVDSEVNNHVNDYTKGNEHNGINETKEVVLTDRSSGTDDETVTLTERSDIKAENPPENNKEPNSSTKFEPSDAKIAAKYDSSDTGNETSSTDFNNEQSLCECKKQLIRDLASTVKSYDIYRKINRSLKVFNVQFNDMGRSLLGNCSKDSHELLSPVKLDERLVCRMIGMHLLHYGLFDVYEQLKLESERLWGPNHIGTIGSVMVTAYRTLHGLLDQIRNGDIDPVLEWTKLQYDSSNLHIQRFNEIMINLYKIRFLSFLYNFKPSINGCKEQNDTNGNPDSDIIQQVKNSGITSLWKIHNDEIGKLVTQLILGENKPTESEFEELKNKTIKMFTKLFCESGILIKKPPNYDKRPLLSQVVDEQFSYNTETKTEEIPEEEPSKLEDCLKINDNTTLLFAYRPILNDQANRSCRVKYNSWLLALGTELETTVTKPAPEFYKTPLRRDWLNLSEKIRPKQPKMAYRYLNSKSLENGRRINFIRNKLCNNSTLDQSPSISKSVLITTLCDPETFCRQNLSISDNMLNNIPYYVENQLTEDETSSLGMYTDPGDWTSSRIDRTTTVLIATGSEESEEGILGLSNMGRLIENYSSSVSSEESSQRTTPTFSLTVFAGPSIFRDSRLSSQLMEADIISQRLLNVSPGSRIRIRVPTLTEEELRSPPMRETLISPYEPPAAEPPAVVEEEEQASTTIERSSITLRDILRMIMRGLRVETQSTVVRFRGSRQQQNLEDSRTSPNDSDSPKDKVTTHKRLIRPKSSTKSESQVDSDYIKVHLPYESPLSVVTCAGHVTFPYLLDVLKVLFKERCEVSSKVGMWLKSNQQLPVESDLGPAFHFHSYLTCAVSKDQTSNENLPIMLSCGHVICKICHDRLSGKRRKRLFKCPMCPTMVEPNQVNSTKNNKISDNGTLPRLELQP
uniref:RING-type zinc-finger containing protein, putative n=1 Tax=Theileria annulata TaxID=5874 RepID=A0A3B0MK81_THEAN